MQKPKTQNKIDVLCKESKKVKPRARLKIGKPPASVSETCNKREQTKKETVKLTACIEHLAFVQLKTQSAVRRRSLSALVQEMIYVCYPIK